VGKILAFRPPADPERLQRAAASGAGISDEDLRGEVLGDVPQAARGNAGGSPAVIAWYGFRLPAGDLAGSGDLTFSAPELTPAALAGADLVHDLAHDLCGAGIDLEALIIVYRQIMRFLAGSASPGEMEELRAAFAVAARQLVTGGLLTGLADPE
jgi:hypothetical protein